MLAGFPIRATNSLQTVIENKSIFDIKCLRPYYPHIPISLKKCVSEAREGLKKTEMRKVTD